MSDFKSKLPDLNELTSMTAKLFKGIKASVSEIIQDYKQKRAQPEAAEEKKTESKSTERKSEQKTEKPKDTEKESSENNK